MQAPITKEEAIQVANNTIGPTAAIFMDSIIEKPYGWYFTFQSKEFVESGNQDVMWMGIGYEFLVENPGGRVINFGTQFGANYNLAAYEAGLKYEVYNLYILSVNDMEQTVDALTDLQMIYVIPTLENNVVWKIPNRYSRTEIAEILSSLPVGFTKQRLNNNLHIFDTINKLKCCVYKLTEHKD
jgi:hypothetical protein